MTAGGSPGVPVMAVEGAAVPGVAPSALSATPAVSFGEGRRPESRTQVQLAEFDGPLALLLSLIEARQLDVLTVPLGALADAYLDALGRLEADRLGNVSSFVAIASQLILIKSRAMLPRRTDPTDPTALADEGIDPEAELRARLLIYRAHRDAGQHLADEALRRIGLFRREPAAAHAAALAGARPADAPPLDPNLLVRALDRLAAIAPPPEPPPEVLGRIITITERADIIRAALRGAPTIVLQELLAGVRDRVVISVTFLAMLELMKRREIVVEQAEPWGPIVARATTTEERAAAGVAPTVADLPLDESLESFA
jgi:segregation and condensation protein A